MTLLAVEDLAWRPTPDHDLVLSGVALEVDGGESIAVRGPSGSGKSSLLRCIAHLQPFERGLVRFRGAAVDQASVVEFRRRVQYVPQVPTPVHDTVGGNLEFVRTLFADADESAQRSMLADVGLGDVEDDRPFERLSVGERQRLCLVRALSASPQVLLLDEPTASLDADNVATIEKIVAGWVDDEDDRAAVWVTHDAEQADRIATRTLRLADGRIS